MSSGFGYTAYSLTTTDVTRYHRIIDSDFTAIFNMLESVFAVELDVQLRYDILADQRGKLRLDLAEDRLRSRRREVSVGELHLSP